MASEDAGGAHGDIWIEKYRPSTLDEVVGQDEITARLRRYIERNDLPNLLFSGPAGVGKCVTGDTRVHTARGLRPIEDLVADRDGFGAPPAGLAVLTRTPQGDYEYVAPSHTFAKPADSLVVVETQGGARFRATPEHPVLTDAGDGPAWTPASRLSEGDQLVQPSLATATRAAPAPGGATRASEPARGVGGEGRDAVARVELRATRERVYDLTVPGSHNYVAGRVPVVMHNTASAVAIARELYGDDWADNFLELNASDDRGIDVIRTQVKNFADKDWRGRDIDKPSIIFLDEADALTSDAQSALRRTMERFSRNTRFILSCNYSSQIIDPIQSRCAVFRYSPLPDEAVADRITQIADIEGIDVTEDGVEALVYAAAGDMRKAINALQAAAVMGKTVDESTVFTITSTARPETIEEMVTAALDGDFNAARGVLDELLTDQGLAGGDIIDQLHRSVWDFDLDDQTAVRVLDRLGETDYRITEGANERLQLEALLAAIALENR